MLEELLCIEKRLFHKRFLLYIGLPLLLWTMLFISPSILIPVALLNIFGLYKSFLLLEDYLFLRKIVREYRANTLIEFINTYFTKTKSQLSNSRTTTNQPKVYSKYGVVSGECTKKYEMNLIFKIRKIIKSVQIEKEDNIDTKWEDDYSFES